MPSFSESPAAIGLTGGTTAFSPPRFSPTAAIIAITGGAVSFTVGDSLSGTSASVPKLDRMRRQVPIGEVKGGLVYATQQEQTRQQRHSEAIERAFSNQQGQITDLATIVARLAAAEAKAETAAVQAQATASADALAKSYVTGLSLSAISAGTITISAHTRVYGDGSSVAVNAGSVTGFAEGAFVQVYYEDSARAGGAVTYQGTLEVIAQQGARHIVGGVAIPVAGSPPESGFPPFPPGYIPDYREYGI